MTTKAVDPRPEQLRGWLRDLDGRLLWRTRPGGGQGYGAPSAVEFECWWLPLRTRVGGSGMVLVQYWLLDGDYEGGYELFYSSKAHLLEEVRLELANFAGDA